MYILHCNGPILKVHKMDAGEFWDFCCENDCVSDVQEPTLKKLRERCLELAQMPDDRICMDASFYREVADKLAKATSFEVIPLDESLSAIE